MNTASFTFTGLENTDKWVKAMTSFYRNSQFTGPVETFKSIHDEIDLLTNTYKSISEKFEEYQILSVDKKNKRSQISIIFNY